jgi:hypothetical protein
MGDPGAWIDLNRFDLAVAEADDLVGVLSDVLFVRDDDDGLPAAVKLGEQ